MRNNNRDHTISDWNTIKADPILGKLLNVDPTKRGTIAEAIQAYKAEMITKDPHVKFPDEGYRAAAPAPTAQIIIPAPAPAPAPEPEKKQSAEDYQRFIKN